MIWTIVPILVLFWLLGFSLHVGGAFIHALLVLALIVMVFQVIAGRRSA